MYIQLICVGKIKEKFYINAVAEYAKRLQGYHSLKIVEVPDEPDPKVANKANIEQLLKKEEARILKLLPQYSYVIILDIDGKMLTSEAFADQLKAIEAKGISHITFIIGSSFGLSDTIKNKADFRFSLSPLTFPHQLCRVIFLEQLYRATRINVGAPYHK